MDAALMRLKGPDGLIVPAISTLEVIRRNLPQRGKPSDW
jgi:hypothetical protein